MTATYLVIFADEVVYRAQSLGEAWAFQQGHGEPCEIARRIRVDEPEPAPQPRRRRDRSPRKRKTPPEGTP